MHTSHKIGGLRCKSALIALVASDFQKNTDYIFLKIALELFLHKCGVGVVVF